MIIRWPCLSATLPSTAATDRGDECGGGDGKARLEQVVAPHIVQEQHVRQEVGVKACARDDGQRVADEERLDAQVCRFDQRHRVVSGAEHESDEGDGRRPRTIRRSLCCSSPSPAP